MKKPADPPDDARSDIWFTYLLGKQLKELYKDFYERPRLGNQEPVWDYEPDPSEVAALAHQGRAVGLQGAQKKSMATPGPIKSRCPPLPT